MTMNATYIKDLVERVGTTFLAGSLGAWGLDLTSITDLGWKAWLTAGVGAGIVSALKGFLAKAVGSNTSASLVPTIHNDFGA
jgi:hypothetical protein